MRSLTWRWAVAIVVGSLWGALVAPARSSNTVGKRPIRAAEDAVHYGPQTVTAAALALRVVKAQDF
jgi:hypothetical protein